MVGEFRAVLRSRTSGFAVRSIVVEAAAIGTPIPALKKDFAKVLLRTRSPYAERLYALIALLRIGPEGEAAAEAAFRQLGTDVSALRLRAEMIQRMYGRPFGSADVTTLLNDMGTSTGETLSGVLHVPTEHMPVSDIALVHDNLELARDEHRASHRNHWEIARFIDRALARAWRETADIAPARAFQWLRLRNSYSGGYSGRRTDDLRAALRERPELLRSVTDHFFETLVPDQNRWSRLARFLENTFFQVTPEEMLAHMTAHMGRVAAGSRKELFLYEAALAMSFSMDGQHAVTAFEQLCASADNRADLRAVRDASMSCEIPSALLNRPQRDDGDSEHTLETQRRNFEKEADAIRNNQVGWSTWAAQVYFGLFSDLDKAARPRERLVNTLGEANAQIARQGFLAALPRTNFPKLSDVVTAAVQHRQHNWWLVMSAGLMERWEASFSLAGLSDELLKAALAFNVTNPIYEQVDGDSSVIVPGWKTVVMQDRPELAREAYVAVARAKLANGDQMIEGLRELMVEDALKSFRGDTALEFLRDFPNADPYRPGELFDAVLAIPATHREFLALADRVLTGATPVDRRQHDMRLAVAYLLSPSRYEGQVEATAILRPAIVLDLRDQSGYGDDFHGDRQPGALPLPQLEFLAKLTGALYPERDFSTDTWGGNTNPWDAAEYCRKLVNAISATPSESATDALRRLETNADLASYKPHLRHALASQQRLRRDSEYDRPDWPSTVKALSNGPPATVADLHALLLDQLDDLRKRIARENTDIYKSFWNLDRYSRPKSPRPEEACRDTLVTLLRPALAPKGITVEPEGHMVADKRADISTAMPGRKILCELKRDYHDELWTAADQQLERFYAHDPEAKGFGIYGALWFGSKRPSPMPRHPDGLELPKSAAHLEQMLRDRIPAERRSRLAVVIRRT
jgi:hypothetical protein